MTINITVGVRTRTNEPNEYIIDHSRDDGQPGLTRYVFTPDEARRIVECWTPYFSDITPGLVE